MKVALVHEWFTAVAGSERVVSEILKLYPQADLFSVVDFLDNEARGFLLGKRARTTFIQRMPWARKRYRAYLPLMPLAIEQLDMSSYDLVISSNHAVAKGVITGPAQVHLCYVHSPMRYAWDLQHQYLEESGLANGLRSFAARALLHYLRLWDVRSANGVDVFLANSRFVARRVEKAYRRSAQVVYPPVDVRRFDIGPVKDEFYLAASRLVPYKRMGLIVEAFRSLPTRRLVVIGDGPEMKRIQALAGPNVTILGYQPTDVLVDHMQRAKALLFAAEEDFGIMPVEAQACGTPVIAFGRGGALETVIGGDARTGRTGVLFDEQSVASLAAAIDTFERLPVPITSAACRANAERFSVEVFRSTFRDAVEHAMGRPIVEPPTIVRAVANPGR